MKTLIMDELLQREGYHIYTKPKNIDVSNKASLEFAALSNTKR